MATGRRVFETLVVRITSDTAQYMAGLRGVNKASRTTEENLGRLGMALTRSVTIPLAVMGGAAVFEFARFDKAMTESLAIMKGVTPQIRKHLEDIAIDMSKKVPISADKMAQSFFYLTSAGLDLNASLEMLPVVTNFAVAGMFDMARATDLLTDAQSALGMTFRDNAELNAVYGRMIGDVLVSANQAANATVEQFATALTTKAAASMKLHNTSLEEGVAILTAYADQGIKAERAGTMMDRAYRLMAKAATEASDVHKLLNFNIHDTNGEFRHMADIIDNLDRVLQGLTDDQKTAILIMMGFQARSQQAITPLLGMGDTIRDNEAKLGALNSAMVVAEKNMASFSAQVKILWNNMKGAAIAIGEEMEPAVTGLMVVVNEGVQSFKGLNDIMGGWLVKLTALGAAVPLGAAALGLFKTALTAMGAAGATGAVAILALTGKIVVWMGIAAGAIAIARELGIQMRKYSTDRSIIGKWIGEAGDLRAWNEEFRVALVQGKEMNTLQEGIANKQGQNFLVETKAMKSGVERSEAYANQLELIQKNLDGIPGRMADMNNELKKAGGLINRATAFYAGHREPPEITIIKAEMASLERRRENLLQMQKATQQQLADENQPVAEGTRKLLEKAGIATAGMSGQDMNAAIKNLPTPEERSKALDKARAADLKLINENARRRQKQNRARRAFEKKWRADAALKKERELKEKERMEQKAERVRRQAAARNLRLIKADYDNILGNARDATQSRGSVFDFFSRKNEAKVAKGDLFEAARKKELITQKAKLAKAQAGGGLRPSMGYKDPAWQRWREVKDKNNAEDATNMLEKINAVLERIEKRKTDPMAPANLGAP